MRKPIANFTYCIFIFLLSKASIYGQDLHFLQFNNSPLQVNPGLTGEFEGKFRFNAGYRRQWSSLPVDYETLVSSVDWNFCNTCLGYNPYSLGLEVVTDQSGLSQLGLTKFSASGAIRRPFFGQHTWSYGLMIGLGQRKFQVAALQSNARLLGSSFSPLFDEESFNNTYNFWDLSMGMNTRFRGNKTGEYIDFGIGIYHLNRYNTSFYESRQQKQSIRYNIYLILDQKIGSNLDLLIRGFSSFINKQNEIIGSGGVRIHLNSAKNSWNKLAIELTGAYRIADAIVPSFGLLYQSWFFSYSHDITTSKLSAIPNGGGPELTLRYTFKPIKIPLKRVCPTSL